MTKAVPAFAGGDNMQTILPSEFKRQMVVMLDGVPYIIEDMRTSGTAQTRHKLHTRLRHVTTGRVIDRIFADNERPYSCPTPSKRDTGPAPQVVGLEHYRSDLHSVSRPVLTDRLTTDTAPARIVYPVCIPRP